MVQHDPDDSILHRIVSVVHVKEYALRVLFDDGRESVIDLEPILHGPLFDALRDPALFNEVQLDSDFGALVWSNGADIDPMVLYDWPLYVDEIAARWKEMPEERA